MQSPPELTPSRSTLGRGARFEDAATEVARVLRLKHNYYAVLKVQKDTPQADIRSNYLRLSRLLHPDKCRLPDAGAAAAVLNQAHDTLSTALKKGLYDRYVDDVNPADDVSYAEWEAQQAAQPVQLPAWLTAVLQCPGGSLLVLLLLLPLTLLLVLFVALAYLICLPVQLVLRYVCCLSPKKLAKFQEERAQQGGPPAADPEAALPAAQTEAPAAVHVGEPLPDRAGESAAAAALPDKPG